MGARYVRQAGDRDLADLARDELPTDLMWLAVCSGRHKGIGNCLGVDCPQDCEPVVGRHQSPSRVRHDFVSRPQPILQIHCGTICPILRIMSCPAPSPQ
jgi:hypothetical protein